MAVQDFLFRDSQCVAGFDGRASTRTGTTLSNPVDGSGQFLAVVLSTSSGRTVALPATGGSSGVAIYGVLQNKPQIGISADVGVLGYSKCIAGASIALGAEFMTSSTAAGTMVTYSTASGAGCVRVGLAIEAAAAGQIFTGRLYGVGVGAP